MTAENENVKTEIKAHEIQISLARGTERTDVHRPVRAYPFGSCWAAHRADESTWEFDAHGRLRYLKGWNVTHVPTGLAAAKGLTRAAAMKLGKLLGKGFDLDTEEKIAKHGKAIVRLVEAARKSGVTT